MRLRDCDQMGLSDPQRAALTGFSGRAVRALAHLREAWCVADPANKSCIVLAIIDLLRCHSLLDIPAICERVLTYGLDAGLAGTLLVDVGIRPRGRV